MQSSSESKSERIASDGEYYQKEINNGSPKLFSQAQLNDLKKELNLSEKAAQILGSKLKKKIFLKRIQFLHGTVTKSTNLQNFS